MPSQSTDVFFHVSKAADTADALSFHHRDPVAALHDPQPMGDNDHRFSLTQVFDRPVDLHLILRVCRAGGLVQDKDRGVFQDRSCNTDPLFLSPGETAPVAAHLRVISVGK